jgi:hypothetical protein
VSEAAMMHCEIENREAERHIKVTLSDTGYGYEAAKRNLTQEGYTITLDVPPLSRYERFEIVAEKEEMLDVKIGSYKRNA